MRPHERTLSAAEQQKNNNKKHHPGLTPTINLCSIVLLVVSHRDSHNYAIWESPVWEQRKRKYSTALDIVFYAGGAVKLARAWGEGRGEGRGRRYDPPLKYCHLFLKKKNRGIDKLFHKKDMMRNFALFNEKKRADARKRYTAMVPRHKGVYMNTP